MREVEPPSWPSGTSSASRATNLGSVPTFPAGLSPGGVTPGGVTPGGVTPGGVTPGGGHTRWNHTRWGHTSDFPHSGTLDLT